MGLLKFIFIVFLGSFSLGEVIRLDLGNNVSIKPVDIVAVILLLVWIIGNFKSFTKSIKLNGLFTPIMWVIAIMVISLVVNFKNFSGNEILVGLSYIARWVLYASLFFVVKSFPKKFKEKILYLLLLVGAIVTFFGFIQYFFYSSLRNLYYLDWDEHMYRMFSTFLDPNFAGAFFVLYLIFLLGVLFYLFKNNKIKQAWLIGLISFFTLIAVFVTFSRSALVMLFTSIIIFSILTKKIKWIFGLILISAIFIFLSSKSFYIENINLFRTVSTDARIYSAKTAMRIIKDNPFLGVGFNTYRYAQIKYGFTSAISHSHADAGTDNSFLFVLATTGIIGLIFYLNLMWAVLRESYWNYKRHTDKDIQKYIAITIIASMGAVLINSFFINSLFYPFILAWMWILLGITSKESMSL